MKDWMNPVLNSLHRQGYTVIGIGETQTVDRFFKFLRSSILLENSAGFMGDGNGYDHSESESDDSADDVDNDNRVSGSSDGRRRKNIDAEVQAEVELEVEVEEDVGDSGFSTETEYSMKYLIDADANQSNHADETKAGSDYFVDGTVEVLTPFLSLIERIRLESGSSSSPNMSTSAIKIVFFVPEWQRIDSVFQSSTDDDANVPQRTNSLDLTVQIQR
jgi:hypothetical protein